MIYTQTDDLYELNPSVPSGSLNNVFTIND